MDFISELKDFSNRVSCLKENINTEEATKTSIVLPFFQLLGYDVFNPLEFVPEYTADTGTKKGEKVDYAIIQNGEPIIIIEVKPINTELNSKHLNQLFRYFSVTKAKFSILTNGIIYRFYSDLEEANKMDMTPFLEINLLNIKEYTANELLKFTKEQFNIKGILSSASELKYTSLIKNAISEQFKNPSDQFVKSLLTKDIYSGVKTQTVLDKFRDIVKIAINDYITELLNEKIKNAISPQNTITADINNSNEADFLPEEIETLDYVKHLLCLSDKDVLYKKTTRYAYMHLNGFQSKWICRISIRSDIRLFTLRKFENHDFETEYFFNNVSQLEQIEDIIKTVYEECTIR